MTTGGTYIIKRGGKRKAELFSAEKLKKSIVATCTGAGAPTGQAETAADLVVADVIKWLKDRPEVTSKDIRRVAGNSLDHYHKDASYLYKQQEKIL